MGSTSTLSWNLLFRSCAKRAQFKFINSNNSASASVSVWPGCTRGYRCNSSPTSKSASAFPFRTSLSLLDSSTSRIGFKSSNSSLSSRLLSTSSRRLNSTSTSSSSNSTASTTKDAQLRFAKAQSDAYKLRNRSLFMYTVAVVSLLTFSSLFNQSSNHLSLSFSVHSGNRSHLRSSSTLQSFLCSDWFLRNSNRWWNWNWKVRTFKITSFSNNFKSFYKWYHY